MAGSAENAGRERVAGILLAAGEGSRLGRPKAGIELAGRSLAARGAATLRDGGADPVVVVVGAADVQVPGATVVRNTRWRSGMGSSLRVGLAAVPRDCTAGIVALADQPLIGAGTIARLIAAHRAGSRAGSVEAGSVEAGSVEAESAEPRRLLVAAYHGLPRNPVLLPREHWPEIIKLARRDEGARPFLRAHPELVTRVECADTGSPDDIDTPGDLARVAARLEPPATRLPAATRPRAGSRAAASPEYPSYARPALPAPA